MNADVLAHSWGVFFMFSSLCQKVCYLTQGEAMDRPLGYTTDHWAGRKILCKRFSTKSRMVLESRADSGLNPLITESHGGQNGMRAGAA